MELLHNTSLASILTPLRSGHIQCAADSLLLKQLYSMLTATLDSTISSKTKDYSNFNVLLELLTGLNIQVKLVSFTA